MSGRGRPPKRKLEGCQGQRTAAKEARMESITVEVTDAGHLTLVTLTPSDFTHVDPLESTHQRLVEDLGEVSELVMWRGGAEGDNHTPTPQISLGCMRTPNGTQQDCSTQTYHFTPCDLPPTSSTRPVLESPRARRTTALPGISLESIKVEIGEQDYLNHPLVCCVSGCVSQSDLLATDGQRTVFYTLPHSLEDKESWAASLDITLCVGPEDKDEHVCSHHFLSPTKVTPTATTTNSGTTTFKNKKGTRKKKTCDMLIAEEAERIRQGLGGGRPKRTPKPNKNYDWAEIAPLIKADPDDFDDADLDYPVYPMDRLPPPGSQKTPLFPGAVKHENKENAAPGSVVAWIDGEDGEEEEDEETVEEYGPDVSLPTSPRAPPPKPKGRPHRIRDNCCQTETDHKPVRAPLREVRVQCGLSASSNSACSACAHIDWRRLEELLVAVLKGVEDGGEQWWREVRECVGVVLDTASPHTPSHPTNVLKLLRGEDRHPLESDKGIVLVAGQEGEEVEIENVIHPEVEEPISGMREITPGTWSRNKSLKKQKYPGPVRIKTIDPEDDQDIDRLGLAEATEKDEDEFQPGLGAEDEDEEDMEEDIEEEEEEEGDDEDWDIKKGDETKPKKKKRRLQKIKKGKAGVYNEVSCRICRREFTSADHCAKHLCRGQPMSPTSPGIGGGGRFCCAICNKSFTQKISLQYHNIYVHGGERKAACPHCEFKAPDKAKLSLHLRTHSHHRPFVCNDCGAAFKFRSTHRAHVARHTNSGGFVCEICNKAFTMASEMREHSRIHLPDRPFVCQVCGMTFKQKKRLRVHYRAVHLRDKRFVCEVCGSSHINNWNLQTHMKTHAQMDTLCNNVCDQCGSTFRGRAGLAAHIRLRHGDDLQMTDRLNPTYELLEVVRVVHKPGMAREYSHGQEPAILPKLENIEHVLIPQQDPDLNIIEVYSCNTCSQLCESMEELDDHVRAEHSGSILFYPEIRLDHC